MGSIINNAPCKCCERKGCGAYHNECKEYLKFLEAKKISNEKQRNISNNSFGASRGARIKTAAKVLTSKRG